METPPDTQLIGPQSGPTDERQELGRKARKASRAQVVGTTASKGIAFLLQIVLARLLTPTDYGLLTVAILVTGFLTIFTNFGFQTFLIQADDETPEVVNTTFFLQVGFAAVLCLGLYAGAHFVAARADQGLIIARMLRLYSLVIFVDVVGQAPLAVLKRRMDFHLSVQSEIAYTIGSSVAKVTFAMAGLGALCFPLGDIVGNTLKTVTVYYHTRFVPSIRHITRVSVEEATRFGGLTALTSIGAYVANQVDKLLITINFPLVQVGFYNFGYTQSGPAYSLLLSSQSSVLLSLFARLRTDPAGARQAFYRVSEALNFILMPVHLFAIVNAEALVQVVFGDRWLGSVFFIRIFALDYLIRTLIAGITTIQISFGLAGAAARTKLVNSAAVVGCLLMATLFDRIEVYAIFYLIGTVLTGLHNLYVNGRLVDLDFRHFALRYVPVIACAGTAAVCSAGVLAWLGQDMLGLAVSAATFGIVYLGLAETVMPNTLRIALSLVRR